MRHRPIPTAPYERVPFTFWGRARVRTVLATVAASAAGLVPAMLVPAAPAYAANNSSVADITVADAGNWEGGRVTFTVKYTGEAPGDFTFSAADGSADGDTTPITNTHDFDSDPSLASVTFPGTSTGGVNTATVSFTTIADNDTADEDFSLVVTDTNGGTKNATGNIWAASAYPAYTLTGPTDPTAETAVSSGGGTSQQKITVTATLATAMPHPVTIPVATAVASARSGTPALQARSTGDTLRDYTALPAGASITIPAYAYTGTTSVDLYDDALDEADTQYFYVQQASTPLGAATNATPLEVAITDDDSAPSVKIGNAPAVTEAGVLKFPLTLSAPSEKTVTVDWESLDGTQLADSNPATSADYTAVVAGVSAGRVSVAQYTTTATASLTTAGDSTFEGPENVRARLASSTAGATPDAAASIATGVINDDDASTAGPQMQILSPTVQEGDSGENVRKLALTINTGGTYPTPVKIDWKTKDGTAKAGSDFKAAEGSFTIPANTNTATWTQDIPVTVFGDKVLETAPGPVYENFAITLSSTTSTIRNPGDISITLTEVGEADAKPTFNVGDVSVVEGNSGTTMAKVPISLSGPAPTDTVFTTIFTADTAVGSSGGPVGDNDYTSPSISTATIKAGETSGEFNIPINGDTIYERDQMFSVAFATGSSDVTTTDTPYVKHVAKITIGNDDAQPTLTFTPATVTEGQSVAVTGKIVGVSEYPYTLGLTVGGTEKDPAVNGTDFNPPANFASSNTINVGRGVTGPLVDISGAYTWQFSAVDDQIDEPTEGFTVTANETTGVPTGFNPAIGTYKIADDPLDSPPAVAIGDVTVNEKDGNAEVPVDLTFTGDATSSVQTLTIPYYTTDGTAKAGRDYTAVPKGVLSVPPGTMHTTIKVPVVNDPEMESDETFNVRLGAPQPLGVQVLGGDSTVTIKSDDTTAPVVPTLTVTGPAKGAGSVVLSGKAAPGAEVWLFGAALPETDKKDLKKLGSVKAGSDGMYRFTRSVSTGWAFYTATDAGATSVKTVKLTQSPSLTVSTSKGKLTATVGGNPKAAGQTVTVQRKSGTKWVTVASGKTTASGYKGTWSFKSGTKLTLRAMVSGNTGLGINAGYSATKTITIK
jgi:Calx-beta domain